MTSRLRKCHNVYVQEWKTKYCLLVAHSVIHGQCLSLQI